MQSNAWEYIYTKCRIDKEQDKDQTHDISNLGHNVEKRV